MDDRIFNLSMTPHVRLLASFLVNMTEFLKRVGSDTSMLLLEHLLSIESMDATRINNILTEYGRSDSAWPQS